MITAPILPRIYRHPGANFPMYVLYRSPPGWPGLYVVLQFKVAWGQPLCKEEPAYVGADLIAARNAIPVEFNTCLHRCPEDDPTIVETWL